MLAHHVDSEMTHIALLLPHYVALALKGPGSATLCALCARFWAEGIQGLLRIHHCATKILFCAQPQEATNHMFVVVVAICFAQQ